MAEAGVASRRDSEEMIEAGRVEVNGKVVTELGTKVNPEQDVIKVDGEEVEKEKLVYYLLNKPQRVVTTTDDPQGRTTVVDLIDVKQRIYPVGRLDYDVEGLLLLTNDGDVTYALTHPSHKVDKKYIATVKGIPSKEELTRLEEGVKLDDGWTAPAEAELVAGMSSQAIISLTIYEGRKNQVKRMFAKLGYPVKELKRIKMGPLELDEGLQPGEYRRLQQEEITKLQKLVKEVEGAEGEGR
jgi:23S rRNA pseudouridine2605 synthase